MTIYYRVSGCMKFFHDILLTEGWEKGERSGERDRVKGEKGIKAWAGRGLEGWAG